MFKYYPRYKFFLLMIPLAYINGQFLCSCISKTLLFIGLIQTTTTFCSCTCFLMGPNPTEPLKGCSTPRTYKPPVLGLFTIPRNRNWTFFLLLVKTFVPDVFNELAHFSQGNPHFLLVLDDTFHLLLNGQDWLWGSCMLWAIQGCDWNGLASWWL